MTDNPTPELISAAYCALAWIDRKTDTGRRAAERLERALAGVKEEPKLIAEFEMPAPRLELRWTDEGAPFTNGTDNFYTYTVVCIYSLVIALGEHDIRGESEGERGEPLPQRREKAIELGRTFSTNSAINRLKDGWIDTPYRDGAHARWDSEQLGGLPIYAVAGGKAFLVQKKEGTDV